MKKSDTSEEKVDNTEDNSLLVEEEVKTKVPTVEEQVKSFTKQFGSQFQLFYTLALKHQKHEDGTKFNKEEALHWAKEQLHIEISEEHKKELEEKAAHRAKIYAQIKR